MRQKRNRDRVTAEITLFHLMRLASERGRSVSREQAMAFLNQECAQQMWQNMMQAGMDFIACSLLADTAAWKSSEPDSGRPPLEALPRCSERKPLRCF